MTAMSLRGYCRTLSERMACRPAMRITRLTTIASTGRFTNRSVNFIETSCLASSYTETSRSAFCDCQLRLAFCGIWIRTILRLNRIIYLDRSGIAQPENSGADNLIAGVYPGNHSHLIAPAAFEFHNLLAHTAIRLSGFRILHIRYHIYGVAVRSVVNRRCRQGNHLPWLP